MIIRNEMPMKEFIKILERHPNDTLRIQSGFYLIVSILGFQLVKEDENRSVMQNTFMEGIK